MRLKTVVILQLLLILLLSCKKQKDSVIFDFEGSSQISIINSTNDSLHIKLENWYAVPLEAQNLDTILPSSSSILYHLKVQGRNHYDLIINETKYRIFTQPNANDTILVGNSPHSDSIIFLGDLKDINQFLLKKSLKFASPDSDWLPRVNATHKAENFSTVIKVNDSITQEHISFMQQYQGDVPEWYAKFEIDRLHYLNIGFKINSFFYRKALLGKVESLPVHFLDEISASVEAQNLAMLGNMRYMYFLNDYINYRTDANFSSSKPTTIKEWQNHYNNLFATAHKELTGLVKDFYVTSSISRIISSRSYILDTNWIAQVKDKDLRDFLNHYLATHQVLPEGATVPYFYLQGLQGQHYEPEDFQDRILLINFWATWCKPCIKEFPEENRLVEKFKADPVTIVNIGIDSDFEKWKKMVKKYELKTLNLVAQDRWNNVLSEKFDIRGLPHSVLIDWNGRVIQNKCPLASEGIDKQITELLNKMRTEANRGRRLTAK